MTQLFFPSNPDTKHQQLYCYINKLTKIVVVKIRDLENRHCERVVFPAEKFFFVADDDCKLEIYHQTNMGLIRDLVDCYQLKVPNKINSDVIENAIP